MDKQMLKTIEPSYIHLKCGVRHSFLLKVFYIPVGSLNFKCEAFYFKENLAWKGTSIWSLKIGFPNGFLTDCTEENIA